MNDINNYLLQILNENPLFLTLSNKKNSQQIYNKTKIRKISDKNEFQLESFTDKQAFHKNISEEDLFSEILTLMKDFYKQLDAQNSEFNFSMKISKKGTVLFSKKKLKEKVKIQTTHNREKNYILKENEYVPVLFDLGVISKDGKVINSKYDKFRQINRFVELIDDIVSTDQRTEYNIIDFGCGKSYLTFVLYHYITEIAKKKANIVGLDLKKDVIEKCNSLANEYKYNNLKFYCGDIKDYQTQLKPDMVIALHACDTATDYAIFNAYKWEADYILSVPCCQHEINERLQNEKRSLFKDYGIIKERFSALATDAIRSKLLEYCGYEVKMLEFIDISHSPKNILIKARKTNKRVLESKEVVKEFLEKENISTTLYDLILQDENNL